MPLFEYRCTECQEVFEEIQKKRKAPSICPICSNTELVPVIGKSNFHLKGDGWYDTPPKGDD